ncbi:hypothetical protein [Pseudomonas solani]|uniref:hypothetical protein n=1 Tax=Pseudomonas solani TaxID=2731552 RepID=UPI003D6A42C5
MFHAPTDRDSFRFALSYHQQIYGMPGTWRTDQLRKAAELLKAGAVDEVEFLEMRDLVISMHAHAIERVASDRVHALGFYHVIDESNGAVVGVLERRHLAARQHPHLDALRADHDADGQLRMMEARIVDRGAIDGLTWTDAKGGGAYRFHLVGHLQNGRITPRIIDPDHYRLVRDLAREALAAGDQARADQMKGRLHWAAWARCPVCRERFDLVDDCEACEGQGLVPMDVPSPGW